MRPVLVGVAVLLCLVLAQSAAAAPPTVTGVLTPSTVPAGGTSTLTLTLSEPAPVGGTTLAIVWADGPYYSEPSKRQSVVVPEGSRTASIISPLFPTSVGTSYKYTPRVTVPGRSGSTAMTALTVLGASPADWEVLAFDGPLAVLSGVTVPLMVTINRPAPAGGLFVDLTSGGVDGPSLGANYRVAYFPPGAARTTIEGGGGGVDEGAAILSASAQASIRAKGPGDTGILYNSRASWLAAIVPQAQFSLGSSFVYRPNRQALLAVGIGRVASALPTTVSLISDTPGVTVPATVEVPVGAAGGIFTVAWPANLQTSRARIRATWNGQTTTNTIFFEGTPPTPSEPEPTPTPTPVATPIPGDTVEPETHIHEHPAGNAPRGPLKFKLYTSQRGSSFECRLDGPSGAIGSYAPCTLEHTRAGLADGEYTLYARSIDPSGNRDSTPDKVTFKVGPVAATSSAPAFPPPTPRLISPEAGAPAVRTSTVSMWGYGSPGDELRVYDNGTFAASTTLNESGQWFLDMPNVADGTHRYTARAGNAAGLSPATAERAVEVFTKAPPAPVITSPCFNCNVASKTFTLSGTAKPNTTLELFEDGTGSKVKFSSGNGNWSITITARAYGLRRYYVTSTDADGNVSAPSKTHNVHV